MNHDEKNDLTRLLNEKIIRLTERERDLAEYAEEISAQKEELTTAIEELVNKNKHLEDVVAQLKERNFELDQILYRMSHDMRAPLLSIQGILSLLALEQQPEPIKTYSGHIERKVIQMDHILQSLGALSKSILETPVYSTVSLHDIIDYAAAGQKSLTAGKPVMLCMDLHTDLLYTDARLLSTIFNELLANAFTFRDTTQRGCIWIASCVQGDTVSISVVDNGEGLSEEIAASIFNIFYRGSERSRGAGLGLYVARKAANLLGGTLTAASTGSGSTFTLILPRTLPY